MYRVLVADDEPIERMIVGRTIKKYFSGQLEVVEAVNGREAAKFFTEKDCKIAPLDIEMPGVNGLEAAEQIREKDRDCSIIFLTAFDEFSYAKRAISVHALDYLLKPGTEEELCQQIRYADKLLEIKGIGITTVAGFIAEVGDITRFDSTKELQKLAGLELVADSSGKHNGKTKISKRGRKRLRYLLFEAAISVVGKNEEFKEIHRYYTTREKNPLKKMQSLIAVACKLIRVFHVILTKGVSYDASKMLEGIRHPGEQLKAA